MFPADENASASSASSSSSSSRGGEVTSVSLLYYDLLIAGRFRFLMLDSFEISVSGYDDVLSTGGPCALSAARNFLARENPNAVKFSPDGLEGTERRRKVAYNGGIGGGQLAWMESVLRQARVLGQWVLLCSHIPFHAGSSHCSALLWNREEVFLMVKEYSDVVLACLHGRDHDGDTQSMQRESCITRSREGDFHVTGDRLPATGLWQPLRTHAQG